MKKNRTLVRTAASLALLSALPALSAAQDWSKPIEASLSYNSASSQMNYKSILIVSSVVLAAGLLSDNSTLTVLGGVGVLFALVQTDSLKYRPSYGAGGVPLLASGNVTLRVNPFAGMLEPNRYSQPQAKIVLQTSTRF